MIKVENTPSLEQFGSSFFVAQIKGSKGITHAQRSDLQASMTASIERLKSSFPGLDWTYMKDRKNGELLCDVGITIQPVESRPLVGLWRLDCLDASFGAGGYKTGNLHTLNTLSMFGGLQAESLPSRRSRTHVAFRSSYNLAYEVTRKQDNSRELFNEKSVYIRETSFHTEIEAVQSIYLQKANCNSYGVRDEFRVGGKALEHIVECISDAVSLQSPIYLSNLILMCSRWKTYLKPSPFYGYPPPSGSHFLVADSRPYMMLMANSGLSFLQTMGL